MSVTFQQEQLSLMTVYAIFCHVLIAVVLLEQTRSHFLSQAFRRFPTLPLRNLSEERKPEFIHCFDSEVFREINLPQDGSNKIRKVPTCPLRFLATIISAMPLFGVSE